MAAWLGTKIVGSIFATILTLYLLGQSFSDFKTKEVYILPGIVLQILLGICTVIHQVGKHPETLPFYLVLSVLCLAGSKLKAYGSGDGRLYQTLLSFSFLYPFSKGQALSFFFMLMLFGYLLAFLYGIGKSIVQKKRFKEVTIPMFPPMMLSWIVCMGGVLLR